MNAVVFLKSLAFLLTSAVSGASGPLSEPGVYQAGNYGLLLIERDGNRLTGRYLGGGPCQFAPDQLVLEGQFESDVFLGTVMLCQQGTSCSKRSFSLMAFYNGSSASVSGDVQLDENCESTALDGRRFRLARATEEERKRVSIPTLSLSGSNSKKKPSRASTKRFREALTVGNQLLKSKDFAAAVVQFELSLSYQPQSAQAHLGVGIAELNRGNVLAAMSRFQWVAKTMKLSKTESRDLHLTWAEAWALLENPNEASQELKLAVKFGAKLPDAIKDLRHLRALMEKDETFWVDAEVGKKGTRRRR